MLMRKVTVKTTDGQIHNYDRVKLLVHDNEVEIQLSNKNTIVFPRENIVFYSFKS